MAVKEKIRKVSGDIERSAYRHAVNVGMSGDMATDIKNGVYRDLPSSQWVKKHALKIWGAIIVVLAISLYIVVI